MFRGPATISFFADNVAAARDWYAEILQLEAYFERSGSDCGLVYAESRIGDYQTELGIIDSRFRRPGSAEPDGGLPYWHVDDIDATVTRALEMGATEYEPIMVRGEGLVPASVVDPFGNVLGVMQNQHYREMLEARFGIAQGDWHARV